MLYILYQQIIVTNSYTNDIKISILNQLIIIDRKGQLQHEKLSIYTRPE